MQSDPAAQTRPSRRTETSGAYDYLSEGYYRCQDAELEGEALPTCADALDAYVVPVALEKAALAGLPVPEWFLTNEYFDPPCLVYGVNPFNTAHMLVRSEAERAVAARKLTWRSKYAMCCQRVREDVEIVTLRVVRGRGDVAGLESWAEALRDVFRLPVAQMRLLRQDGQVQLSAIEPLAWSRLRADERDRLRAADEAGRG